jgi:hypothetical protein
VTGGPAGVVSFRLWPPVAVGAPLLVGAVGTAVWGDPVDLGGWRSPVGWALVLLFFGAPYDAYTRRVRRWL